MKQLLFSLICLLIFQTFFAKEKDTSACWISSSQKRVNKINRWLAFRQDLVLENTPKQAITIIAADTKYWLWINGKMVLFEGGLKRGPNPRDTYYDKLDLAPYLKTGKNQIAILLWYFGKDGFSHLSSGRAGLLFDMNLGKINLHSDSSWLCSIHPAYGTACKSLSNKRLPESNILFDARNDIPGWQTASLASLSGFQSAKEIGHASDAPWNKLVERPIPQWKDFGIKEIKYERRLGATTDSIIAVLPYNMQMTPIITVKDITGGHSIGIATDHSKAGGSNNLRAEYITKSGLQEYESYGWLNGEKILLTVPHDVEVLSVKYRETGYNTEPIGTFACSDEFYNRFWKKAQRTLYVNMRDNYFDCPDRERAQWWGDAVLLMGESFYTYSLSTHDLMRKAICELAAWQRSGGELFSPIPGNYDKELPDQMLTSIGNYGFWNYYMNTADKSTIEEVYPAVKKYLGLWKTDKTGLTVLRKGDWLWGDWGDNRDLRLIMAGWHYLALDSAAKMADLLGHNEDAVAYRRIIEQIKLGYNKCWNGYAYRHPSYKEMTDERVQALAVISGIADPSKYESILSLFKTQLYASPYMEKYVMEALFVMGEGKYGLERTKKRFQEMVNDPNYTTLFEGWGVGEKGFGGGTTNHAWSGGAQIVISQYLFGIKPLEAGYKTFLIEPNPASFTTGALSVPTIKGIISTSFENTSDNFVMKVTIPKETIAILRLPEGAVISVNKKLVLVEQTDIDKNCQKAGFTAIKLTFGEYIIVRNKAL